MVMVMAMVLTLAMARVIIHSHPISGDIASDGHGGVLHGHGHPGRERPKSAGPEGPGHSGMRSTQKYVLEGLFGNWTHSLAYCALS